MTTLDDFIVETRGLSMEFKGFTAVNNVNMRVRRNTIHALIGPNGAGKTTCFNLITRFLSPTKGQVLLNGKDITRIAPHVVAGMGMVRSFQISAIFPQMSVLENVRVALQRRACLAHRFWMSGQKLEALNEQAMDLLDQVGLANYASTEAADLSYGRKRALEIATTLALDPEVLLLDEPMAGLGREDIGQVANLVRKVAQGRTVLMVEHNLAVVADLSDHITVLARGEILTEGDYRAISSDPRVVEVYIGKARAHG